MDGETLLLSKRPPDETFITLAFGPGVLRFLGWRDLKRSNALKLREEVRELCEVVPNKRLQILDWGDSVSLAEAIEYFGGKNNTNYRFLDEELFCPDDFLSGTRNRLLRNFSG